MLPESAALRRFMTLCEINIAQESWRLEYRMVNTEHKLLGLHRVRCYFNFHGGPAKNIHMTTSLGTHGLVGTSHLHLSRNLTSNVKALRTYSSTIHGCNLVLHRFTGGAKERSAVLREYRKSCDKAGVSPMVEPRSL